MSLGISTAVQRLPANIRAASGYNVGGAYPKLAFDFNSEYYRTNGGQKSFSDAMTFARAGLATMVDSDGLIKWAPHNLLTYSEDFSQWTLQSSVNLTSGQTDPDGGSSATLYNLSASTSRAVDQSATFSAATYTFAIWVKAVVDTDVRIRRLSDGSGEIISITVAEGWKLITAVFDMSAGSDGIGFFDTSGGTGDRFYIWGAHLYRSDLGGMVDNPDRGDSYVPTTSSAVYLPRRGHHKYNGDQWVNKGILVESEARTNVVTYSDQFNNAAWTKAAPTITADAIASPDGNDNADKLIESSTTAHAVYQVPTVTAVAYTFSVFAKSAERTQVNLDFTGGTNGAYFNLSTGEVISSSGTGLTAAITPMGNDWYRCSITQVQSAGAIYPSVSTSVGGARVYLGDGSSGIYIYGAQLEAGSTPSSYIPTSGSTVTRAAETVTVPYANLPYSSIAMSIAMMGEMTYADEDENVAYYFLQWAADSGNRFSHILTTAYGTGGISLQQLESSVFDQSSNSGSYYSPSIYVPFNYAVRHGSTFINGAVDGVALTANTTPVALPDLSTTNLLLAYNYMGTISEFRIWDRDIGDTGIAEATA